MPPWELDELKAAAKAVGWFNAVKTDSELEWRYGHFGGSARRVLADEEMTMLQSYADGCEAGPLYNLVTSTEAEQGKDLSLEAYAKPGPNIGSLVHICPDSNSGYTLHGAQYKFASERACQVVRTKLYKEGHANGNGDAHP